MQRDFEGFGLDRLVVHRQRFATNALVDAGQGVWCEVALGLRRENLVVDNVAELSRDVEECRLVGSISQGLGIG